MEFSLKAISPVDGRYYGKTLDMCSFFSEYALIKYRLSVEIKYFIFLCGLKLKGLDDFKNENIDKLHSIIKKFDVKEAIKIKDIEKITNHDIKAVEYYIISKFEELGIEKYSQYVHYGLTSQDVNNSSLSLILKDAIVYYTQYLKNVLDIINELKTQTNDVVMMSRTHGQAASPTFLGKEIYVFYERVLQQCVNLENIEITTKFGGAVGNLNAHYVAFSSIDWIDKMNIFVESLGLKRQQYTTQIEHYDNMCATFDCLKRINVIFIDLCRDIWTYISQGYFNQKFKKDEVGSSTMPHKINPIDFENAEGNFMLANALFTFFSSKLPISRLQRDLTDSTVSRNIGVAFSHTIIGFKSIMRGLKKLQVNKEKIDKDLVDNWIIVAEAIQVVLKREGIKNGYELLKQLSRNNKKVGRDEINMFIDNLCIDEEIKQELKNITPFNYVGKTAEL